MPDKKCPNCGLWNMEVAQRCDCGFDFDTGQIEEPYYKPSTKSQNMSLIYIMFSFEGRIGRRLFWVSSIVVTVMFFVLMVFLLDAFEDGGTLFTLAASLITFAYLWINLAVQIKRWHDRGKSGWWIFVGLIPIIGPIWALIETGFLPGTAEPNEFGDNSQKQSHL